MSQPEWRDVTAYSRGQTRENTEPRTWQLDAGSVTVKVSRHIHYEPDTWVLFCKQAGMVDPSPLQSKDVAAAQTEAIGIVYDRFAEWLDDIKKEM